MSQTIAFVLPLPVVLALVLLLLGFLALSAVLLSLRQPAPLRCPATPSSDVLADDACTDEEPAFR
ncbi:hypothetical protein [Massilia yuzhufengensis]|uniref:Uncharacterized protein n=1 Tax=Massilia yuzhufengensis TaxID=1164594 RepID=A0A1I1EJY2_9BURK|nr:hypothetical protein [Massilia yuzhufengensis]SFB87469.1 hypothetical protein SAMN05216204_102151 [Massilia yuzhufengensis]